MVITQIILLSQWFGKKKYQKDLVKTIGSKSTCSKWHFGQVGHMDKKPYWGVFFTKVPNFKNHDFL
jgi:hypothetical protein